MSPSTNAFSRSFISNLKQNLNIDHQADGTKENDARNSILKRVIQPEEHPNPLSYREEAAIIKHDAPDTTDRLTENGQPDMWLNFEPHKIHYIEGSGTIPVLREPELPYDPELWDSWLDWAGGEPPREFRIARKDYTFESMHDQESDDYSGSEQSALPLTPDSVGLPLTPDSVNDRNVQMTAGGNIWLEQSPGLEIYDNTDLHRIRTPLGVRLSKPQQLSDPSSFLLTPDVDVMNVRTTTKIDSFSKYPLDTVDSNAWPVPMSIRVSDEQPGCLGSGFKACSNHGKQVNTPGPVTVSDYGEKQLRSIKGPAMLLSSIAVAAKPHPRSPQTSIVADAQQSVPTAHNKYSKPTPSENCKRKRTDDNDTSFPPRKIRGRAPHTNIPTNGFSIPLPTPSLLLPTWQTIPVNDHRRNPLFFCHTAEINQCVYMGPAVGQDGCGSLVSPADLHKHLVIHAQMEESMVLARLLDVDKVHALLWAKKMPFRCSVTGCGFYIEAWQLDGVKERHEMEYHPNYDGASRE